MEANYAIWKETAEESGLEKANLSISVTGRNHCSGIVSKHLDSHLRLIVYMSITYLQQSQNCSKKFISWAPAILSDECDSCAAPVDWCVCMCGCSNAYHLALSRHSFLIWRNGKVTFYSFTLTHMPTILSERLSAAELQHTQWLYKIIHFIGKIFLICWSSFAFPGEKV